MQVNNRKLLLLCDATYAQFTLITEKAAQTHRFESVKAALAYASGLITEEAILVVCNQLGEEIVQTTLAPTGGVLNGNSQSCGGSCAGNSAVYFRPTEAANISQPGDP